MSQIDVPLSRAGFGQTQRADNWWVQPLVVFLGLSAFIVYSTWAALQGYRSDAHTMGAGRLSIYVLLLSRCILQGFLGGSTLLHRGRAAQDISR